MHALERIVNPAHRAPGVVDPTILRAAADLKLWARKGLDGWLPATLAPDASQLAVRSAVLPLATPPAGAMTAAGTTTVTRRLNGTTPNGTTHVPAFANATVAANAPVAENSIVAANAIVPATLGVRATSAKTTVAANATVAADSTVAANATVPS